MKQFFSLPLVSPVAFPDHFPDSMIPSKMGLYTPPAQC
jgi:hypothetical protein